MSKKNKQENFFEKGIEKVKYEVAQEMGLNKKQKEKNKTKQK